MPVDPAAAAASGGGAAALDALVTAELNALAADAQALQNQVAIGDILDATVLPSNGLSDLLSIQGNRVAASLPPTLVPGDQITVEVTGFNGPQILLQILSTAGAPGAGAAPPPSAPATSSSATASTAAPQPPTATAAPAATASPGSQDPVAPGSVAPSPVAPSSAVFVAASVRPNAPVPPPIPPGQPVDEPPDGPPGTIPGAPGTTVPAPVFDGIEARLAAARAAQVAVATPNARSLSPAPAGAPLPDASRAPAAALRPPPAGSSLAPAPGGSVAPPFPRGGAYAPQVAAGRTFVVPPPIAASRLAASAPVAPPSTAAPPPAAAVRAFQEPVALVRALNLPVTPSNVAAARLALDAPQRLPAALATLESALGGIDDPRVATLRTIVAFVGKIEPSSPQLATQIAAYVDHVVSGSEPALAQLLAAHAVEAAAAEPAAAEPAAAEPAATDAVATEVAPVAGETPAAAVAAPSGSTLPVVALAQVTERAAAIAVSLKEQLFSLVNGPPVGGREAEAIVPSAASALTAVTSIQLATAGAAAASPQTLSFSLPMWLGATYAQAHIAVDRDAPERGNVPLDGDNFHIAFVLDTKNLGTVAVDLRTVGRAFSLSVKTENLRTAQRFGDELSRLTDRLSSLRYQAKSIEAVVAAAPGETVAPAITASDPGFNLRA